MIWKNTGKSRSTISPCSGSLAEELHEPSLHAQPAESRAVEQEGVEYQVERNPLTKKKIGKKVKKWQKGKLKPGNTSCRRWL